jgi:N-methylhydantoinase B
MSEDPIVLSVVNQSLGAIAEEMIRNLIRSAYSTIVREARDASTALLTPEGRLIAQADRTIPILLNAFPPLVDGFRQLGLLDGIQPGQALITNDAYAGGQHLDDVVLIMPVYEGAHLLGWAASLAHHLDLGAGTPGINPKAHEVFEEGVRIPRLRIDLEQDMGPNGILSSLLAANIRVPDQTLGDLRAQIAAVRTGERRLRALAGRHGHARLQSVMDGLLDYTDTMMRRSIAGLPDGRYYGEDWIDDDGEGNGPLRIAVTIDIKGDEVEVDMDGTAPQARGSVNAPLASTVSTVHTLLKYLLLPPNVPANEGCTRAVHIKVPEGTVLNPTFPAAVGARMGAVFKLFDAMLSALAPVLPELVIAPSFSAVSAVALSQRRPGVQRLYRESLGGGYGAGLAYEGASGTAITLTNTANTPIEFTERAHPYFMIEEYSLRRGSGGVGQFCGGMGIVKQYHVLDDDVLFAAYSDRHRRGAAGLFGGGSGERAQFLLLRGDSVSELPSKIVEPLRRGDVIRVLTGGGGAYGPAESPSSAGQPGSAARAPTDRAVMS